MSQLDQWMPFFLGDYMRDTQHLSQGEHGAFMLLIFYAWTHDGLVPSDLKTVYRIARAENKTEKANILRIISQFFSEKFFAGEKFYFNKKVNELLELQKVKSQRLSENGRKGGVAKAKAIASDLPEQLPKQMGWQNPGIPDPDPEIDKTKTDMTCPVESEKPFKSEAKVCFEHLKELGLPNLQNLSGAEASIRWAFEEASKNRADISVQTLIEIWKDACQAAAKVNASNIKYPINTFKNKAKEYQAQPASQTLAAQPGKPKSRHSDPRVNRFLAAKRIRNRFTGLELDRSQFWDEPFTSNCLYFMDGGRKDDLPLSEFDVIEVAQ